MRLPTLSAEKSIGPPIGIYCSPKIHQDSSWGNNPRINPQSTDDRRYLLAACARSHADVGKEVYPPEHCFLKLIDPSSSTALDSLSFSYNQVVASPDNRPDDPANRCETVDVINWGQWQQLRQFYQDYCAPEQFDMKSHNCCSCVQNSVESVLGLNIPTNITQANGGLGTVPRSNNPSVSYV